VNGKYTFAWLDPSQPHTHVRPGKDIYDIEHVLAHESGHTLGLSDELERDDVLMYRYTPPNDPAVRTPTDDDLRGLAEIYARVIAPVEDLGGCGESSVSPARPQTVASRLALAFGVGFLTYLVSRKRRRPGASGVAGAASLATFALTLLPTIERSSHAKAPDAHEEEAHATASIVATSATFDGGVVRTHATLRIAQCRIATCPSLVEHDTWGGTVGTITQVVGHDEAPVVSERVELTFEHPTKVWDRLKPGFQESPRDVGAIAAMRRARALGR